MIRSDNIDLLATALCDFQSRVAAIPKNADNPFFKSKYADLAAVKEVSQPILTETGLSVAQFISSDEKGDTLVTWLLHKSGQFLADTMAMRPIKNDPQAQGSAVTYARRYSYMAVLGLVADDDDDGNAASSPSPRAARPARSSRTPATVSASSRGKATAKPPEGASGAQDASQGASSGTPVTEKTLEELASTYRSSGADQKALKAIFKEVGAASKRNPAELTEDEASWVILKLREHGKAEAAA